MASKRNLLAMIEAHARMCADFESMGSGEFRRKHPDYDSRPHSGYGPEGVHYITRKAEELARVARASLRQPNNPS